MNIYKLLQLNRRIKNHRIKFFGLYMMHRLHMRYLAVNLDPIMACNLRCKMCYFTDPEYVRSIKGQLHPDDLVLIAKRLFKRAIKLQIGCGTEPTLYKNLTQIVALGSHYKVPYISLTTNANLLDETSIKALLDAGLHEFTISLHGVKKSSYENFMQKASFEKFQNVFKVFERLKQSHDFKVRINYTFNKDNFHELVSLFDNFNGKSFDILQLRPIKNIGNTAYQEFELDVIKEDYPKVIAQIQEQCQRHHITLLAPKRIGGPKVENTSSYILDYTFCYVSPDVVWKKEFDWKHQTFSSFCKEIHWPQQLFENIFRHPSALKSTNDMLNYDIELN